MAKLGRKQLTLNLQTGLAAIPPALVREGLALSEDHLNLVYTFDGKSESTGIPELIADMSREGIAFRDLKTDQSSLEDIFVSLVRGQS